jgi:hypothetical protein
MTGIVVTALTWGSRAYRRLSAANAANVVAA